MASIPSENQLVKSSIVSPPSNNQILIDYLSSTLPDQVDGLFEFSQLLGVNIESWQRQNSGAMGYRTAFKHPFGAILLLDGSPGMGSHCSLSGSALGSHFENLSAVVDFLRGLDDLGGKVSRLDLAFDDITGQLDLEVIRAKVEAGCVVSRYKDDFRRMVKHDAITGKINGETLYFGSASSETLTRIYDKWAQTGQPGKGHWIRVEIQFRKRRCRLLVARLLQAGPSGIPSLAQGLLTGLISFRDQVAGQDRYQWPVSSWWSRFTDGVKRLALGHARPGSTIHKKVEWFAKQCSKGLAQVATFAGPQFLADMVMKGISKTRETEWVKLGFVPCLDFGPMFKQMCNLTTWGDYTSGRLSIPGPGGATILAF